MRKIFVDACYWIAMLNKDDQLHQAAVAASVEAENAEWYTTDSVMVEVFNHYSKYGAAFRRAVVELHNRIQVENYISVIPQSREQLRKAMTTYEKRQDKGYSLTDCYSMAEMTNRGITEILTYDHHFEQEGYQALLRKFAGDRN